MQAVNLLPKDAFAAERSRINLPLIGAGMVPLIALGLVIHGYGSAHSQVGTAISELSVLNAQIAEIAPAKVKAATEQEAATAASSQLVGQRQARIAALQEALATSPPMDTFLEQLARILPADVWLSSLNATPATASAAGTFTISGSTYSDTAVAQLLARLALLPSLSDITLTQATTATATGTVAGTGTGSSGSQTLTQFSVTATPVTPTTTTPATTTPATTTPATTTAGGTTSAP